MGLHGTVYSISDPEEMMKVVRSEGPYPSGTVEKTWPLKHPYEVIKNDLAEGDDFGLLGKGERWKSHRVFLQTGMMDPRAVKGFIPGIVKAAEFASKGAPHYSKKLNLYINYCVFEMFNTFMFGDLTHIADPGTTSDPENEQYCEAACKAFDHMFALNDSPSESVMHYLGIRSKLCKEYEKTLTTVREIGVKKIDNFIVRYKQNDLNELKSHHILPMLLSVKLQKGATLHKVKCVNSVFSACLLLSIP